MDSRNHSERWRIFQKKKNESINSHKREFLPIIYGAYNPPPDDKHLGEKERLLKLCEYLKKEGYVGTDIVENIHLGDESPNSNIDKSFGCLEIADLNILVFTFRGSTDSVVRELTCAIDKHLLYRCKVFEEKRNEILAMGTLSRDELIQERYTIVPVEEENDNDLHEHVSSEVYSSFYKFINKIVM